MVNNLDKDTIFQSTTSGKKILKTFKEYTNFLINSKTPVKPSLVIGIKESSAPLSKLICNIKNQQTNFSGHK